MKTSLFSVFHIVSPLTGSKATIITTDTTSTPNHAPVLIQAAQRIVNKPYSLHKSHFYFLQNRPGLAQNSNLRKRLYPFTQETDPNT